MEYYSAIKKNEIDRFVGQGEVRKRKINIIYSCKYEKQMMIIGSRYSEMVSKRMGSTPEEVGSH